MQLAGDAEQITFNFEEPKKTKKRVEKPKVQKVEVEQEQDNNEFDIF